MCLTTVAESHLSTSLLTVLRMRVECSNEDFALASSSCRSMVIRYTKLRQTLRSTVVGLATTRVLEGESWLGNSQVAADFPYQKIVDFAVARDG